jgi:transcriptional regulator of arginine metabolism
MAPLACEYSLPVYSFIPVSGMKGRRQALILDLVDGESVTSQAQLQDLLAARGIQATQATLSRDIRDLGLIKRAADGAYRRPDGADGGDPVALVRRAVPEYLRRQERVDQLVVLKTDPGQAQSLAVALDRSRLPEIVGTIAGDDTILVICRSAAEAESFAARLEAMRT